MAWAFLVLQRWQNLGWRFGFSRMHWESVIVLCFVVRYFISILVFAIIWGGKEMVALLSLSSWWLVIVV